MNDHFLCALLAIIAVFIGAKLQWWVLSKGWCSHKLVPNDGVPPADTSPRIVVNVPADYKPLEPLMVDGKPAVVGPRALLWYSAYRAAISAFSNDTCSLSLDEEHSAFETATGAVEQVYGNTHDS